SEISPLSLHDALPIWRPGVAVMRGSVALAQQTLACLERHRAALDHHEDGRAGGLERISVPDHQVRILARGESAVVAFDAPDRCGVRRQGLERFDAWQTAGDGETGGFAELGAG